MLREKLSVRRFARVRTITFEGSPSSLVEYMTFKNSITFTPRLEAIAGSEILKISQFAARNVGSFYLFAMWLGSFGSRILRKKDIVQPIFS